MKLFLLLPLLFATQVHGNAKLHCEEKELARKNCVLNAFSIRMGLSDQKIRFTKGPWTSIADFPSSQNVTHWQDIRLENLDQRTFLLLKVWQKADQELTMEELYWRVLEVKEKTTSLLLERAIGKRSGEKIQDNLKSTKLSLKEGKIIWHIQNEQGELKDGV